MEEEGRKHQRVKVNWPVSIQTKEGTIERATYNISPGGAFIRGWSPLELNEVVDMVVNGLDHDITTKARVVWTRSQVPPSGDRPRGVGVELVKISDEHRKIISSAASDEIECSASNEDEKNQSLIREQNLREKNPVDEENEDNNEPTIGPPKRCPEGHRHISWSMGDDHIFCWDCNRRHPLVDCFKSPGRELSDSEKHND